LGYGGVVGIACNSLPRTWVCSGIPWKRRLTRVVLKEIIEVVHGVLLVWRNFREHKMKQEEEERSDVYIPSHFGLWV
jgi:hypothetical protein